MRRSGVMPVDGYAISRLRPLAWLVAGFRPGLGRRMAPLYTKCVDLLEQPTPRDQAGLSSR